MSIIIKNQSLHTIIFLYIISHLLLNPPPTSSAANATTATTGGGGHWIQLQRSIGISAMHMQVLNNNKVIIFDRTNFGPSNISLPRHHRCRFNPRDMALKLDCTAHSVLYDILSNSLRPLTVQTDTWCSSAAVNSSGTLVQTGGFHDGYNKLRTFTPCDDNLCDWVENNMASLSNRRWYASNQILPDGRIIVVGGRNVFTYEFVPKNIVGGSYYNGAYFFSFLKETKDPVFGGENNLYPFLHLLPDENLFVFANKRSVLFDFKRNRVIREYPVIPGHEKRNYPSTGSSVLLPLNLTGLRDPTRMEAEVVVCGGAFPGAFSRALKREFVVASRSCGRIRVTDPDPKWVMEVMPIPRVMSDMIILPTGDVLIINGRKNGTAGWENAVNPVFHPVLYKPNEPDMGRRFEILSRAGTARMYHSSAVLLPDGRILVGGSNPHKLYDFRAYPNGYPTDLSLDAYYPDYLNPKYDFLRPNIIAIETVNNKVSYEGMFSLTMSLEQYDIVKGIVVSLVAPSFTTHSFGMNQRMLVLDVVDVKSMAPQLYRVTARGPLSPNLAPPGYYMLFVVHAGIPSGAVWVHVK